MGHNQAEGSSTEGDAANHDSLESYRDNLNGKESGRFFNPIGPGLQSPIWRGSCTMQLWLLGCQWPTQKQIPMTGGQEENREHWSYEIYIDKEMGAGH